MTGELGFSYRHHYQNPFLLQPPYLSGQWSFYSFYVWVWDASASGRPVHIINTGMPKASRFKIIAFLISWMTTYLVAWFNGQYQWNPPFSGFQLGIKKEIAVDPMKDAHVIIGHFEWWRWRGRIIESKCSTNISCHQQYFLTVLVLRQVYNVCNKMF